MRIIFFGTPDFAAQTLQFLLDHGVAIVAVVTKPDKAQGRSSTPLPTPVKKIALERNAPLALHQPPKASTPEFVELLKSYRPDLFVVVAYGEIMKQNLLDVPSLGCINVHASILPKYRGAAPIERAIMNGEKETGITIMHMALKLDAGDIIEVEKVPIGENTTALELRQSLCKLGSRALLKVIHDFESNVVTCTPQDDSQMTLAPKIEPNDCLIDWSKSAQAIHNLVRGTYPNPGAWAWVKVKNEKKRLKILSTRALSTLSGKPGEILGYGKEGIIVACGEGAIKILELQLEGKRPMSDQQFISGYSSIDIN